MRDSIMPTTNFDMPPTSARPRWPIDRVLSIIVRLHDVGLRNRSWINNQEDKCLFDEKSPVSLNTIATIAILSYDGHVLHAETPPTFWILESSFQSLPVHLYRSDFRIGSLGRLLYGWHCPLKAMCKYLCNSRSRMAPVRYLTRYASYPIKILWHTLWLELDMAISCFCLTTLRW